MKQYKSGKFYKDEFRGELSWNGNEYNNLLRNEGTDDTGSPMFADVAMGLGADDKKDARGMAVADFDNDGDLDIVINTNPGDCGRSTVPPVLLRNDIGGKRNFLVVELKGVKSNRDAIGAEVSVEADGAAGSKEKPLKLFRHVYCGSGYASQNDTRLFFGLGEHDKISKLTVKWPGGKTQTFDAGIKANRLIRIVEGAGLQQRDMPGLATVAP